MFNSHPHLPVVNVMALTGKPDVIHDVNQSYADAERYQDAQKERLPLLVHRDATDFHYDHLNEPCDKDRKGSVVCCKRGGDGKSDRMQRPSREVIA